MYHCPHCGAEMESFEQVLGKSTSTQITCRRAGCPMVNFTISTVQASDAALYQKVYHVEVKFDLQSGERLQDSDSTAR